MQPVRRTQGFTNGEASFGGPPGGFVWSVQVNVPTATNSDTFQLYINGEQLTSTAGTGLMGPVQVFSGETVTIKSSNVAAGTKAFMYGQVDKQGQQPSGIFPAISGGTVSTQAVVQLNYQQAFLDTNTSLPANTPINLVSLTLPAGTWILMAQLTAEVVSDCTFSAEIVQPSGAIVSGENDNYASNTSYLTISLQAVVVLAGSTTINLAGITSAASTVVTAGTEFGAPATLLTAVQIA